MLLGQNAVWKTDKIGQSCRKRQPCYIHRKIKQCAISFPLVCQRFACVWPMSYTESFLKVSTLSNCLCPRTKPAGIRWVNMSTVHNYSPGSSKIRPLIAADDSHVNHCIHARGDYWQIALLVKRNTVFINKIRVICCSSLLFEKKKASLGVPQETTEHMVMRLVVSRHF